MQGTHFCPKEQSWYQARRGDTERRTPGISPAAKEECQAQPSSPLPAPDCLPSAIPGYSNTRVLSQCCSRHRVQHTVRSRNQPLGSISPLWLSSSAPSVTPEPSSPTPRGRDRDELCHIRDARDAAHKAQAHLAPAASPATFVPALPRTGRSVHPYGEATCSQGRQGAHICLSSKSQR